MCGEEQVSSYMHHPGQGDLSPVSFDFNLDLDSDPPGRVALHNINIAFELSPPFPVSHPSLSLLLSLSAYISLSASIPLSASISLSALYLSPPLSSHQTRLLTSQPVRARVTATAIMAHHSLPHSVEHGTASAVSGTAAVMRHTDGRVTLHHSHR